MKIIDFHAHAFPDFLAPRALAALSEGSGVEPETDGTVAGLLAHMDSTGVRSAVLLSIATNTKQVDSILSWSTSVQSERLIPFASIHPDTPDIPAAIEKIANAGIKGIKLHPLYQSFAVDEKRVFPIYEAIAAKGLILLFHAGYDIAFDTEDNAAPKRIAKVLENFPKMKVVLAHMGGWKLIDEVIEQIIGKDVWIDTSYSVGYCSEQQLQRILSRHSTDRIVFGSDTPWGRVSEHIEFVNQFPVSDEVREKIFHGNAEDLLSGRCPV